MSVKTKQVKGRRKLRYQSFDDLLEDAETVASHDVSVLGNWHVGQIFEHLAKSLNMSVDGADFSLPKPVQWFMRTFLKSKFLNTTLSPGFTIPSNAKATLEPQPISPEEGLTHLRDAIARVKSETKRGANPVLGALSKEESDQFQLRHSEMHMSFVIPK